MNKKILLIITLILVIIIITIVNNTTNTKAYEYNEINTTLFYKENKEKLKEDIKKYINNIDNILIPTSSYNDSEILTENYDFLTRFSIKYIINNIESYQEKIINLENFKYTTKEGIEEYTDKYIDIKEIYKISKKYFNIEYYDINNKETNIINNYISLSNYTNYQFKLSITNIDIDIKDNTIYAKVEYENNNKYLYKFINNNNILTINNIEVLP